MDLTIKLPRIASRDVRKTREENQHKGIANEYVINEKSLWHYSQLTNNSKWIF